LIMAVERVCLSEELQLDLESLRTFVHAVQLGSLTAAARALSRSQPAVTIQIQGLEREAGDQLLIREPRGVRPTKVGEILYVRAQAILREAEDLMAEIKAVGSVQSGAIRVGATDVMAINFLPPVLQKFRKRYPGIKTAIEVEGSHNLATRVQNGDIDLALVTLPVEHPDLSSELLHQERIIFVAPPGHHLAGRRIKLQALAEEPIIHHKRDSVTRAEVGAVFRVKGLEPQVAMEVSSPDAIRELVVLGLGIAPLSMSQVAGDLEAGRLIQLNVPEFKCWRRSGVIRRRNAPPIQAVSAFLSILTRVGSRR
jgi:DNA-binding transcriptional LysR family regulator